MRLLTLLVRVVSTRSRRVPDRHGIERPALDRPVPREMRVVVSQTVSAPPQATELHGPCWVVDGDTIIIDKQRIRIAGIDAPELDHPYGQQAKWALVNLCKGQVVTARITPELSYDRLVAQCFLSDGRDLAAEMVRAGHALDWPKFSGGKYGPLEHPEARKKLWRAAVKQRSMATLLDDLVPVVPPPSVPVQQQPWPAAPKLTTIRPPPAKSRYWLGWLAVPGFVLLPVGCALVGGNPESRTVPPEQQRQAPPAAIYVVTAVGLNVRESPSGRAAIVSELKQGTMVVRNQTSGRWYGIVLQDGSTGWVHSDFLASAGN